MGRPLVPPSTMATSSETSGFCSEPEIFASTLARPVRRGSARWRSGKIICAPMSAFSWVAAPFTRACANFFAVDGQRAEAHAASGQRLDRAGKRELAPQQPVDGGESALGALTAPLDGLDASLAWRARERGAQSQRAAQIALGELREARQIGSRDFRFAVQRRRSGLAGESDGCGCHLKLGEANIGVAGAIRPRPQIERYAIAERVGEFLCPPMRVRRREPRRLCRYARRRPSAVRPRSR